VQSTPSMVTQFRHYHDFFGQELLGDATVTEERSQLCHCHVGVGELDKNARAVGLTEAIMRQGHEGDLLDGGMGEQEMLDLDHRNVSPPRVMMSLVRPQIRIRPASSSKRARSPVFRYPVGMKHSTSRSGRL
jgi:hypothetical protein